MYNGEVNIFQEDLDRFLAVAQRLKLEGLLGGKQEEQDTEYLPPQKEETSDPNQVTPTALEQKVPVKEWLQRLKGPITSSH